MNKEIKETVLSSVFLFTLVTLTYFLLLVFTT